MSIHTLRCTWPILNDTLTLGQLIEQAWWAIPVLAIEAGATILPGQPTWRVDGDTLTADIPARPHQRTPEVAW